MEEENEGEEPNSTTLLKLPLLPLTIAHSSPEHASTQTLVPTVPFKWEQQPGIPRPCTDIIVLPQIQPLVLPKPPLLLLPPYRTPTATPTITTVLDGPHNVGRPKSYSFRFFRDHSFDSTTTTSSSSTTASPESITARGVFRKFSNQGRKKKKKKVVDDGGNLVFSSPNNSCHTDEKVISVEMRRNESYSIASKSTHHHHHVWVAMYEGLKQAIPWKSTRKSKIEVQV